MRCERCGETVPSALALRLHLRRVHDVETREGAVRDPLAPLEALGIRPVWVRQLGDPAVHVPSHQLLLLDADLSRAEVFAYVRQLLGRITA